VEEMVQMQLKELYDRRNELGDSLVKTIYFGGGTPSVLKSDAIKEFIGRVEECYTMSPDVEITLEANPDDLTKEKIRELKESGVNRLSVGIQSFREQDLVFMNRSHNAGQSDYAVKSAQDNGFENITIDLIYAIPGLDIHAWKENLRLAGELNVPHISAYCLTIEEKTVFGKKFASGKFPEIDTYVAEEQFECLVETLPFYGINQYEVSNFSKEGYESKHNTSYWNGESYLGIGPSAHSYGEGKRSWNISNNTVYMNGISKGCRSFEEEVLDDRTIYNEYVMTSLRTVKGLSSEWISRRFGISFEKENEERLSQWMSEGKMKKNGDTFALTTKGFLWADRISSDLFVI